MKKRFKKLGALLVVMALMLTMSVSAFAEKRVSALNTPPYFGGATWINAAGLRYLNAYTNGTPQVGTNVTTYATNSPSATQFWIADFVSTDRYVLITAPTITSSNQLVISLGSGNNCILSGKASAGAANCHIRFIYEGAENYGIALVNRTIPLAILESTTPTVGGYNVIWGESNGKNNQLWRSSPAID